MDRRQFGLLGVGSFIAASLPTGVIAGADSSGPALTSDIPPGVRRGSTKSDSYWGAGPEKVDLFSGNLNFKLPLLTLEGRGFTATVYAAYNSQNLRREGQNTRAASDIGCGEGWCLQLGALLCDQAGNETYYTFIDETGLEHYFRRVQDRWISTSGSFMTWVPASRTLYFADGTKWSFGCVSANTEIDASTMYPTLLQDTNGNQIRIGYLPGKEQSQPNSSGRIAWIQDSLSIGEGSSRKRFAFEYEKGTTPRLTRIVDQGGQQTYDFTYNSILRDAQNAGSPQIAVLSSIGKVSFEYDDHATLSVARLLDTEYRWSYQNFVHGDGQSTREVATRGLKTPSSPYFEFSFERSASDSAARCHDSCILHSETGARRAYAFQSDPNSPHFRNLLEFTEYEASGDPHKSLKLEWTCTDLGSPYVTSSIRTLDPGKESETTSRIRVTRDSFGNQLSKRWYNYDCSTPHRSIVYSYLTDSSYQTKHILNRRTSASLDFNGKLVPVWEARYDTTPLTSVSGLSEYQDLSQELYPTARGNATEVTSRGVSRTMQWNASGRVEVIGDESGSRLSMKASPESNGTRLGVAMLNNDPGSAITIARSDGHIEINGPNGATVKSNYNNVGRLIDREFPDGRIVKYSHSTEENAFVSDRDGRWRKTVRDSLGRILSVQKGDAAGLKTTTENEYGIRGFEPTGGLYRATLPHASTQPSQWVSREYDSVGRPIAREVSKSGNRTVLEYSGNSTIVRSGKGGWKKLVHNSDSSLAEVILQGANPNAKLSTKYEYNALGKLTSVVMPRARGTQSRSFQYDSNGRLKLKKHAESGAVGNEYNPDGTLSRRVDSKGQTIIYHRDSFKRVTAISRSGSSGKIDPSQSATFTYDTNPLESSLSQNAKGKLTVASWGSSDIAPGLFSEMYSYDLSGRIILRRLRLTRGNQSVDLDVASTYNLRGKLASLHYPLDGPKLTYHYDSMHRLIDVVMDESKISEAEYTPSGRFHVIKRFDGSGGEIKEELIYNDRSRLAGANIEKLGPTKEKLANFVYDYDGQSGRLTSERNDQTGEDARYEYDDEGRLVEVHDDALGFEQAYSYDEFDNRIEVRSELSGHAETTERNPVTNWLFDSRAIYDANGNICKLPGMEIKYDIENRPRKITNAQGQYEAYEYDSLGRRVWQRLFDGREVVFAYGPTGQQIGSYYLITDSEGNLSLTVREIRFYLKGRLVRSNDAAVVQDKHGNTRIWSSQEGEHQVSYSPFGQILSGEPQSPTQYAGYERDSTGLDYAWHRYYSSELGTFLTPDPYDGSAILSKPNSWNRYAFTGNDPVNNRDRDGLQCIPLGAGHGYTDNANAIYHVLSDETDSNGHTVVTIVDGLGDWVQGTYDPNSNPPNQPIGFVASTGQTWQASGFMEDLNNAEAALINAENIAQSTNNFTSLASVLLGFTSDGLVGGLIGGGISAAQAHGMTGTDLYEKAANDLQNLQTWIDFALSGASASPGC